MSVADADGDDADVEPAGEADVTAALELAGADAAVELLELLHAASASDAQVATAAAARRGKRGTDPALGISGVTG